jgi:hypothetical protein
MANAMLALFALIGLTVLALTIRLVTNGGSMPTFEAETLKTAAKDGFHRVSDCPNCGAATGFVVEGDTVLYRAVCHCSYPSPPDRVSSFEEMAATLRRS